MSPAAAAKDLDSSSSEDLASTTASATAAGAAITVAACLQRGTRTLASRSDSPRLDAELLLGHTLKVSRSSLVIRGADAVSEADQLRYDDLIAQRAARMPIAYLVGSREFWSLDLHVTPDVLVPRPETELLVELTLQHLPKDQPRTVVDLGTGSGAIALAIARERPLARIIAVDLSPRALAIASENAVRLGLSRVEFRAGSWFDAVPGLTADLIVSNPPYVANNDPALELLVHEPALALAAGPTGLDALRTIVGNALRHLNPGGRLLLEHGHTQDVEVAALLQSQGFDDITSHVDYSGKPRVTLGTVHHTRDT